eukprot:tig00000025_g7922.t1
MAPPEEIIARLAGLLKQERPVRSWKQELFGASVDNKQLLVNWLDYVQTDAGREALYEALNAVCRADLPQQARARASLAAFLSICADAVCQQCSEGTQERYVHLRITELAASLEREGHAILRSALVAPFMQKDGETAQTCHRTYGDGGIAVPAGGSGSPSGALAEACVRLPARISFAGGWLDTPPHCLEKGGLLVHAAIELDGRLPITAFARLIPRPQLELASIDLSAHRVLSSLDELRSYTEPGGDAFALHKAVLSFFFWRWVGAPTGSPAQPGPGLASSLASCLEAWCGPGRGLELATEVYLPKGSGLGTSSILALACLRALRALFSPGPDEAGAGGGGGEGEGDGALETRGASGRVYASSARRAALDDEYNAVLAIEQMLTTGGGWNDQVGGGTPGIKRVDSKPGVRQAYTITHLELSPEHKRRFNEKLLVVYTGQQRLAKTVLSRVVSNWVLREEGIHAKMERLRSLAEHFFGLLERFASLAPESVDSASDAIFDAMGAALLDIRRGNVALEETWTNENVDALYAVLEPFVSGSYLVGAGSGGFVVGFLRAGATRGAVGAALREGRRGAAPALTCVPASAK